MSDRSSGYEAASNSFIPITRGRQSSVSKRARSLRPYPSGHATVSFAGRVSTIVCVNHRNRYVTGNVTVPDGVPGDVVTQCVSYCRTTPRLVSVVRLKG